MSELFDQNVELLPTRTMMSTNFGGDGDDIFIDFSDGDTNTGAASGENDGVIHDNLGRVHHFEVTPY
ncbi:MAG: hypothetical protein ACRDRV_15610 [Pseudonocardiaceae bacterium]